MTFKLKPFLSEKKKDSKVPGAKETSQTIVDFLLNTLKMNCKKYKSNYVFPSRHRHCGKHSNFIASYIYIVLLKFDIQKNDIKTRR